MAFLPAARIIFKIGFTFWVMSSDKVKSLWFSVWSWHLFLTTFLKFQQALFVKHSLL